MEPIGYISALSCPEVTTMCLVTEMILTTLPKIVGVQYPQSDGTVFPELRDLHTGRPGFPNDRSAMALLLPIHHHVRA